jgi:predicted DNA-binding transcriptional regulator AlpA
MNKSLRPKHAAEYLGIGRATLWRWSKERADFPKPSHLSARCVVFDADALKAWRDAQVSVAGVA